MTLIAAPAAGWRFSGWSGACSGSENCTLSMEAARSVTANFVRITYALALSRDGSGDGGVASTNSTVINCGSLCSAVLNSGTTVALAAKPAAGSVFAGWSGACSGTGTCSVAMNDAKSVVASFTRTHQSLGVARSGTGSGTITSAPAAIACGSTCSALVPLGSTLTLTAAPAAESVFTGWSGACSGNDACSVTLSEARSVVASFTRTHFTLSVARSGTGGGRVISAPEAIDCGTACRASLPIGTVLTLTPVAAEGSRFTRWTGACTGTGACTVTMSAARSVGASFAILSYAMTLSKDGSGSGTVTSAPAGLSCGTACSVSRTHGSVMTLTAVPSTGTVFAGWGGACSGTGTCTLTVTAPQSVSATFTRTHYPLAVTKSGTGLVVSTPAAIDCGAACSALMPIDTEVALAATPAAEFAFGGWSGACTGSEGCAVAMTAARSVKASFVRTHYGLTTTISGTGAGRVSSLPEGVDCDATCRVSLPIGSTVTLTAAPAEGSRFTGWSGVCAGTGACTVTMSAVRSVTARFASP